MSFPNFLHPPPMAGMMTGMAYLQLYGFFLKKTFKKPASWSYITRRLGNDEEAISQLKPFDIFSRVSRAEWDTLMFFYGVILCVGGLGFIGYLAMVSQMMYGEWGATPANVMVGVLSAIVDNIPVMVAVLTTKPQPYMGPCSLDPLSASETGGLLSICSAAVIVLLPHAHGR